MTQRKQKNKQARARKLQKEGRQRNSRIAEQAKSSHPLSPQKLRTGLFAAWCRITRGDLMTQRKKTNKQARARKLQKEGRQRNSRIAEQAKSSRSLGPKSWRAGLFAWMRGYK